MKKYLILLLTSLIIPFQLTANASAPVLEWSKELKTTDFSGQVMVAQKGKIVFAESYGIANREKDISFERNSVFDIGSITKQFVATAILKLEEQGKLKVSDPISKFLPDTPSDKQSITLHHLLTHSAGFDHSVGFIYEKLDKKTFVKKALAMKLLSEPGTKYRYSNIGYGLLGVIIEQVSSNGYEEYISQHILAPAGLDKTGYRLVERDEDRIAVNYGRDPNLIEKIFGLTADSESVGHSLQHRFDKPGQRWNLEGSGGFLSTVEDMYKWYMVLRSKGILSEDSWDKIMQPYVPETEEGLSHYGYGWVVDKGPLGNERIWHDGSNGYCFAVFHYYPKLDVLIFYATNNKDDHPQQFMKKLDEIIISNLK